MTETDNIVARLQPHLRVADDASVMYRAGDIRQVFAHITRLEERCAALTGRVETGAAEIERVTKERDEERLQQKAWGDKWDHTLSRAEAAEARADALQAEVERKDAALKKVSDWIRYELPIPTYAATTMLGVVLNALQPQEPKP